MIRMATIWINKRRRKNIDFSFENDKTYLNILEVRSSGQDFSRPPALSGSSTVRVIFKIQL
jgi:hypothetical protein